MVHEIAAACELIRLSSGEILHRADQPFDSIFLVIHGRVQTSLTDIKGNVLMQRFQTAGSQIGALAAALGEPSPIEVVAAEPSTILRLNYQKALELTKQHDAFRQNFSRSIADSVRNMVMKDRRQKKPVVVACFHQSSTSRPLTRRLITRLQELGEDPCVLNDQTDWQSMDDVPYFCLVREGGDVPDQEVREHVNQWSDSRRIFIDVAASVALDRAATIVAVSEKVFWCVTPENWQESVSRLEAIEQRAPAWRDKINIVWLLDDGGRWAPLCRS